MIEAINHVVSSQSPLVSPMVTAASANQPAATGFAEMMTQLTSTAFEKVGAAEQVSIAKMAGAEMPLREIVDKVMEAQQALNTTLAIRDKIVQAYIEISHTQI